MSEPIPVAFYAPLKSPDGATPSGDRAMARLLMRALEGAGFAPSVASRIRTYEPRGDPDRQDAIRRESLAEADRLLRSYRQRPASRRPRLWFTYHCYYKAPDWIGPVVADGLGIPYVVAEGSRAGKRASGPWALGHRGAEAALDRAQTVFVMGDHDRGALERARIPGQRLVSLSPFLDLRDWPMPKKGGRPRSGPVRLLTVAMMRSGDKLASYRLLAEALAGLSDHGIHPDRWRLTVVGDGSERSSVARLLAPFKTGVRLCGRTDDRAALAGLYEGADLLVWPAVNEAYGMVLLEAQVMGCPVLAGRFGGVSGAMDPGRTGVLTPPGDVPAFAEAMAGLIRDPARLDDMRRACRPFVADQRSLSGATSILASALLPLVHDARGAAA